MSEFNGQQDTEQDQPSEHLSEEDKQSVTERAAGSAKVIHEVVRLQGEEELDRPIRSLFLSGFAAGVGICASLLAEAFLHERLPDSSWRDLVVSLGYSVGFVIVILGNLQLFTESTVTAVLPLATHWSGRNLYRLFRLWIVVFLANMLGTLLVAVLMSNLIIITPVQLASAVEVSRAVLEHDFKTTVLLATPAGFLIASVAWILPNARGNEFWVIVLVTYVVGLGKFSHVVAGAGEAWLLACMGEISFLDAATRFILPALLGNIIGGTGLFAVLAHGQVREEIRP